MESAIDALLERSRGADLTAGVSLNKKIDVTFTKTSGAQ